MFSDGNETRVVCRLTLALFYREELKRTPLPQRCVREWSGPHLELGLDLLGFPARQHLDVTGHLFPCPSFSRP